MRLSESYLRKVISEAIDDVVGGAPSFNDLVEYIRTNKSWSQGEEARALRYMESRRCGIDYASNSIYGDICDLIEEFVEDYGLPSGFNDVDEISPDEVFMQM